TWDTERPRRSAPSLPSATRSARPRWRSSSRKRSSSSHGKLASTIRDANRAHQSYSRHVGLRPLRASLRASPASPSANRPPDDEREKKHSSDVVRKHDFAKRWEGGSNAKRARGATLPLGSGLGSG